MKAVSLFSLLAASFCWAQQSAPPAAAENPDKVVAIFDDGSKMTQGEFQALLAVLPDGSGGGANLRQYAETNLAGFLHWYGVTKKAAALFQSQKLGDKPEYKREMDFTILEKMADIYVREGASTVAVTQDELQKYYDDHKDVYRRLKVSGFEVAFGSEDSSSTALASHPGAKTRPEEEARAKAEKLVVQLRAGADWTKTMQTENDDDSLKAKGGDLGTWSMTDNVPDLIRSNVLGLKEGAVSDPIRQNGGYYIVHADAVTYAPLSTVEDGIRAQLTQAKAQEWLKNFADGIKVQTPDKDPAPQPNPSGPRK